jgi:dinuclear metal center YbgI/SA1388 family protein
VLVGELQALLEELAPARLAESWDNVGLLVGDERAAVRRILVALELTEPVLEEALAAGCDTILTHHPFLFSGLKTFVESRPRERVVRKLIAEHMTLIACHTNLDSAAGGIAVITGAALGLQGMEPLEFAQTGWYKLVGFVPASALDEVAAAVFAAGGGGIGNYKDCAFAADGIGWFTPLPGSDPTVGEIARPERTPEVRWETVVPKGKLSRAVRAFVQAHPYEEPAFDIYPVEDVVPKAGLGRLGRLSKPLSVGELAARVKRIFELDRVLYSGDAAREVSLVGILPGSGRSWVDNVPGVCDVLITGDLSYHMGEQATERGYSLIDTPHGGLEWWAFKRWGEKVGEKLAGQGVVLSLSERWSAPWTLVESPGCGSEVPVRREAEPVKAPLVTPPVSAPSTGRVERLRIWIDGGSRGNPGPSAIGVVVEDDQGNPIEDVARVIGVGTNNVAEYQALLTALEIAEHLGASQVQVVSDSELLVRQMLGQYKVKNEGLKPLFEQARRQAAGFKRFAIKHVERKENARADALVNKALDEQQKAGL